MAPSPDTLARPQFGAGSAYYMGAPAHAAASRGHDYDGGTNAGGEPKTTTYSYPEGLTPSAINGQVTFSGDSRTPPGSGLAFSYVNGIQILVNWVDTDGVLHADHTVFFWSGAFYNDSAPVSLSVTALPTNAAYIESIRIDSTGGRTQTTDAHVQFRWAMPSSGVSGPNNGVDAPAPTPTLVVGALTGPSSGGAGTSASYSATISNSGSAAAVGMAISFAGTGLTGVTISPPVTSLAAGAAVTVTATGTLPSSGSAGASLSIARSGASPVSTNTVTTTVVSAPAPTSLGLGTWNVPTSGVSGTVATSTLVITNTGSVALTGITAVHSGSGLTSVSISGAPSSLAAGASATITVTGTLPSSGSATTALTVNYAGGSAQSTQVKTITVTPLPATKTCDALVSVVPLNGPILPGQTALFEVTIQNLGPDPMLSWPVTFSGGSRWSVLTPSDGLLNPPGQTLGGPQLDGGSIGVGPVAGSVNVPARTGLDTGLIRFRVEDDVPGSYLGSSRGLTVSVAAGPNSVDSSTGNNSSTGTVGIVQGGGLTTQVTPSPSSTIPGAVQTITAVITNNSTTSDAVTLTIAPVVGLSVTAITTNGSPSSGTAVPFEASKTLTSGQSLTVTVSGVVDTGVNQVVATVGFLAALLPDPPATVLRIPIVTPTALPAYSTRVETCIGTASPGEKFHWVAELKNQTGNPLTLSVLMQQPAGMLPLTWEVTGVHGFGSTAVGQPSYGWGPIVDEVTIPAFGRVWYSVRAAVPLGTALGTEVHPRLQVDNLVYVFNGIVLKDHFEGERDSVSWKILSDLLLDKPNREDDGNGLNRRLQDMANRGVRLEHLFEDLVRRLGYPSKTSPTGLKVYED